MSFHPTKGVHLSQHWKHSCNNGQCRRPCDKKLATTGDGPNNETLGDYSNRLDLPLLFLMLYLLKLKRLIIRPELLLLFLILF